MSEPIPEGAVYCPLCTAALPLHLPSCWYNPARESIRIVMQRDSNGTYTARVEGRPGFVTGAKDPHSALNRLANKLGWFAPP